MILFILKEDYLIFDEKRKKKLCIKILFWYFGFCVSYKYLFCVNIRVI